MPVVLTVGTIAKLALVILVPLVGAISAGAYHYHNTNQHIDDTAIHLTPGERHKLETKVEAMAARAKVEASIKREMKLQTREIKADVSMEQKVQIKQLKVELKLEQKALGDRLMGELKQARRDIRNQ